MIGIYHDYYVSALLMNQSLDILKYAFLMYQLIYFQDMLNNIEFSTKNISDIKYLILRPGLQVSNMEIF